MTKRTDDGVGRPLAGLAEERVTRARAIKLAGAMVGTGAFALLLPDEADAANRRQRRRRRRRKKLRARRRRQAAVTSPQPTVPVNENPTVVPIKNEGDTTVNIVPQVSGGGFELGDLSAVDLSLAPGQTALVPVTFTPQVGDLGVQTGELRILDGSDGLLLETVTLTADVTAPVTP